MTHSPIRSRHATRLLIIAAALVALAACDKKARAPGAAPPPDVGTVTVTPEPLARTTELPGRTGSVMTADVRPQVAGVILQRLFTEGGEVQAGQPLYQIDPAYYQAAYDSAVATLARNEATAVTARAKAARYRTLAAAQAVSTQDYDDAVATAKEAQADIGTAKASVQQAKINLVYTKVLAPLAGHIGRSSVTPGALVTAEQTTALATVTQLDPIYVELTEASTTLLRLRRELAAGQIQSVGNNTAKVTLKLEDGSPYGLPGTLQFTEVTVDQSTGTVLLRAVFPNPDRVLLPGMYVHAELEEGVDPNAILLPQQAVSRNSHGDPIVLVIGKDDKAEQRVIQTSATVGASWLVTGGVKAGERVIVDGLQKVRPGMVVHPVATGTAAAGGATAPAAGKP